MSSLRLPRLVSWMQDCMPLAEESSVRQLVSSGGRGAVGEKEEFLQV